MKAALQHNRAAKDMYGSGPLRRGAFYAVVAFGCFASALSAAAQDSKPYDDKIMRLSEILGAIHYLRELCGADDGQLWRQRMQELISAEGTTALRRARLTRAFNQGYRSYSRTYTQCTPTAKTAIGRFFAEATQLTSALSKIP
jgi:uncharacterized protein (TIGR02301 family)